jgi:hypothetical protein
MEVNRGKMVGLGLGLGLQQACRRQGSPGARHGANFISHLIFANGPPSWLYHAKNKLAHGVVVFAVHWKFLMTHHVLWRHR